ncbi:MAG: Radical SAM domain protein [Candidatus Daviesbacteria bacterium GW2011_GWA2_40_9]|uniref:Radical SAM domain protein n=1 Tax=Candidatus Daviesbacteria bacterium GW2011_GWA2_40_9 TaxID=1618424 RepID=A0A0G0U8E8_9BACT|nr:MAG: Radical SAM domain protein [Candidatus Daviesbacteria bacterium GW2011_GWC1_40_9]KKR83536.1 MAG: Radical SAM domain protein [Candidatus Daviesbacteria bacterium GW2011_GWA2_40_9]
MEKIPFEEIPHFVQIETSYNCNAHCSFCYNPNRNNPPNYKKLRKIVHQVTKSHIPHVQLTGGEVSLLPSKFLNEIINELSKNSNVSIQTNGIIYIKDLTPALASIYISLHGTKKYHDKLQQICQWEQITKNIKKYISNGFEVNLDFTLTSINYNNFEEIAFLANEWGIYQYSINKFEPAGLGVANFTDLVPSKDHFKKIIDQIIRLQDKTKLHIGFCTAVPFCLDARLPEYGLLANCGAGVSLLVISPDGEVRICNQSDTSYGNILKHNLIEIWKDKNLDEFRNKSWVIVPCKDCFLFNKCLGGCKVDNSQKGKYCIDYAVRNYKKIPITKVQWQKRLQMFMTKQKDKDHKTRIKAKDIICPDKFTKLNLTHKNKLLITRHQTISIDLQSVLLLKEVLNGKHTFQEILRYAKDKSLSTVGTKNMLIKLLGARAITLRSNE